MHATTPCPDTQALQCLLLGRLPETDGELLYQHLEECDQCVQFARTFDADDLLLDTVRAQAERPQAENAAVAGLIQTLRRLGLPRTEAGPVPGPIDQVTWDADTTPPFGEVGATSPDLCDFLAPAQEPGEVGRLGPYRVLNVLGSGGMGVVFRAVDPDLQRPVALKAMLPALAVGAAARRRFLREGRAAAALDHDHVVHIYQVGEDRGIPFIAMQLLQGESLEDRLQREPMLPAEEILRLGGEIAQGLAAAHAKGLVHRDIKPANVWLENVARDSGVEPARVKLLDFGLARAVSDNAQLTQQGAIVGTPAFMAPEQANGAAVDARSDLFSLGCVLYRMATGQVPFQGCNTLTTLLAVASEQPRPPAELNSTVPPALSALIMRLLAKDAADRPASAREVIDALAEAQANPNGSSQTARPRSCNWLLLALALLGGGLAGLGAAGVLRLPLGKDRDLVIQTTDPNVEIIVHGERMAPLAPGPLSPSLAPPGPPDSLSLPAHHTRAFQVEEFPPQPEWYLHLGGNGLHSLEAGLGHLGQYGPLAFDSGGECSVNLFGSGWFRQALSIRPRFGSLTELHLLSRLHCSIEFGGFPFRPRLGILYLPIDQVELTIAIDLLRWNWSWGCDLLF